MQLQIDKTAARSEKRLTKIVESLLVCSARQTACTHHKSNANAIAVLPNHLAAMNRSKIIEAEVESIWQVRQHMVQMNAHSQAGDIADGAAKDRTGRYKELPAWSMGLRVNRLRSFIVLC